MELETAADIDDGVREEMAVERIRNQFNVSEDVAERLYDEIGPADKLTETNRARLREVKGVGPKTAVEINRPVSKPWEMEHGSGGLPNGSLVPVWIDDGGKLHLPIERPRNARSNLEDASRRASRLLQSINYEA